ncbi:hypothetical protein HN873_000392 [Arachis hypogaea]
MCKVVEMLEGPLQSVPCSPKPVMSSPTRIFKKKNYDTDKSHGSELYFPDWIYRNFEKSNIHTRSLVSGE